jgi:hypothetical protein
MTSLGNLHSEKTKIHPKPFRTAMTEVPEVTLALVPACGLQLPTRHMQLTKNREHGYAIVVDG